MLALMVTVAGGCVSPPAPQREPSPGALAAYAMAKLSLGEQRMDEADTYLRRAIELDPRSPALVSELARLQLSRRDIPAAIRSLEQFQRRDPGHREIVALLALIYAMQGRVEDGIRALETGLLRSPADAELAAMLAEMLADQNRMGDATVVLRRCAAAAPATPDLIRAAGRLASRVRSVETNALLAREVRDTLDLIVATATNSVEAQQLAADVYVALNDPDAALRLLDALWQREPGRPEIATRMVRLRLMRNEFDAALAVLEHMSAQGNPRWCAWHAEVLLRRAEQCGNEEAAKHDRERAVELLRPLAGMDSPQWRVLVTLGRALLSLEQMEEAVRVFGRLPQDDITVRARLAQRLIARGNTNDVVRRLELLRADPDVGLLARYLLAEIRLALGDRNAGRVELETLLATNTLSAAPYVRLAALDWEDGLTDRAHQRLQDGLTRLPSHLALLRARATLFMLDRRFAEALRTYEDIESRLETDDLNGRLLVKVEQALALQYQGRSALAARRLAEIWDPPPAAVDLFVRLAYDLGRRLRDHAPTDSTFTELVRLRPDDPVVPMYHALFALTAEQFERAVEMFAQAEAQALQVEDGTNVLTAQFHFSYGSALERSGRYAEAEERLETALRLNPDLAEAWNYLAYMWAERGERLDAALRYVREALKREPNNGAFLDTLGWIYYQQGRYQEAEVELRRALAALPEEDPTVLDHLGDVAARLGREADAVKYWSRAWILASTNDAIRAKLEQRGVDLEPLRQQAIGIERQRERELRRLSPILPTVLPHPREHGEDADLAPDEEPNEDGGMSSPGATTIRAVCPARFDRLARTRRRPSLGGPLAEHATIGVHHVPPRPKAHSAQPLKQCPVHPGTTQPRPPIPAIADLAIQAAQ